MRKISLTVFSAVFMATTFGQFKPRGTFVGAEEISALNERPNREHPKHKWYHLSVLTFKGDSVFLEQSPVEIYKTDTVFSASDGGFYTYAGKMRISQGKTIVDLELISCDYCPNQFIRFDPPKIAIDEEPTHPIPIDTATSREDEIIEDITYKYKILIFEKTKNVDEIMVNKNLYRRQKRK